MKVRAVKRHLVQGLATATIPFVLGSFVCLAANAASVSAKHSASSKTTVVQDTKDREILKLKAQVRELEADLAAAQVQIDTLETSTVQTGKPNPESTPLPQITISDVEAQRFMSGDSNGDPMWVVTFEIKNSSLQPIAFPAVDLNCNDNYIGSASKYAGHNGIIVVDPPTIQPGQDTHLKYAWVALSQTEQPVTATISLGSTSVVEPVNIIPAP